MQYPFEPEPAEVWNCSKGQWQDISSQYSDLFFRVSGVNTSSWGTVQEDLIPHLYQVRHLRCSGKDGGGCAAAKDLKVPMRGESKFIKMDRTGDNDLSFWNSGDEVRPRNMAIKIWKCVNSNEFN